MTSEYDNHFRFVTENQSHKKTTDFLGQMDPKHSGEFQEGVTPLVCITIHFDHSATTGYLVCVCNWGCVFFFSFFLADGKIAV